MEGGSTHPSSGRSGSCRIRRTVGLSVKSSPSKIVISLSIEIGRLAWAFYCQLSYSYGRGNISDLVVSYQDCNCASDRMTPSHQDISPPDTPEHHWAGLSIQICPTCCSHVLSPELFFTRVKLLHYNIKYYLLKQRHHKQILRFRHHLVRTLLLLCCHLVQTLC